MINNSNAFLIIIYHVCVQNNPDLCIFSQNICVWTLRSLTSPENKQFFSGHNFFLCIITRERNWYICYKYGSNPLWLSAHSLPTHQSLTVDFYRLELVSPWGLLSAGFVLDVAEIAPQLQILVLCVICSPLTDSALFCFHCPNETPVISLWAFCEISVELWRPRTQRPWLAFLKISQSIHL